MEEYLGYNDRACTHLANYLPLYAMNSREAKIIEGFRENMQFRSAYIKGLLDAPAERRIDYLEKLGKEMNKNTMAWLKQQLPTISDPELRKRIEETTENQHA